LLRDALGVAVEALSWMAYEGIGERAALLRASQQLNITSPSDLREAHKWVMETSRFQNRLDWFVMQVVPEELIKNASHGIRSLLRILAYLRFIDSKPASVLQRIVGVSRQTIGWRELRPYEESIARLVSSNPNSYVGHTPEFERVSLETCHPIWYVKRLIVTFGRPLALTILKRDLSTVATFARVNELKRENQTSFDEQLHSSQVKVVENVYALDKGGRADARAKLASSGEIVIQDLGSIVAGLVAAPGPGQVVLDVCASPGNKTSHLAAQMGNDGEIYSLEISASRSLQWKREMIRTGCRIATLIMADATKLPIRIQADVVLVDPPCSNSGVFARDPTSKWRLTPTRLKELVRAQGEILQEASEQLNEGGTLVYCTCSILPEENELVVETFLKKNPEYTLTQQRPFLGCPGLRGLSDCQRFFPHLHNCNGYFIAKMRKQ